ncbi:aldehyde dehydrogenase family protein [Arachnia rubra]|jgi:coA-dependent propionaldehyde dehydrogenase pduP|uniref:Aldehyde dehydrogenase EutE n=1 Tax=Arachnia rubra TaxID=1547448 RepID=A0ABX7Y581_9ACTN|nr:aldehyde dehydrogenase family protein [Arachnia rubra]MBB1578157.1 aldehyde dehydrogenase EutE [Propionibacterium sp.]MDO4645907.1 aldehyde dehydrogenase EutE [Propionibacteriaceae bacterium]QUC08043.1 aldehyde dehydrogenase EutE [Arachnia rubra]BCR82406.1 aldehyde dehydrogenase [Arachnia rubra]
MKIDSDKLEATIREVLAAMVPNQSAASSPAPAACPVPAPAQDEPTGDGVFADMDSAVEAAYRAQREYMTHTMADRRRYVAAIREAMLAPEALDYMSEQAVAQSGMGDAGHKYLKNKVAAAETPGVEDLLTEAWSGDDGLTTVEYSPYGVIGAITPTTNPTETITCNSIGMLAAGNSVVFSPHPRVARLSCWQVRRINRALREAGAPDNLVVTVTAPSLENTNAMMAHPRINMLVATGGPGIVKAVLSSGKKAIGAGAGNPPAVVDESADIEHAARCIVDGATFDNNLPCTAEKEIIAVDSIADMLKFCMLKNGAYEATGAEITALENLLVANGKPRTEWVGKPAAKILEAIGVTPPAGVRLIVCEASADHPFVVHELMMPVIGLVRVPDVDAAIDLAVELEHGNRHTAVMHSLNVNKLTKMGKLIQTTIFVKNGPSFNGLGIGGEGYPTFTIAGPTGEGLTSARSFTRRRRCVLVGDLNVR